MARQSESTKKPRAKREPYVCDVCGEKKPPTHFPDSKAKTCTACGTLPSEPEPLPSQESAEKAAAGELFTSIAAEIDYDSPTAKEIAARTLARRRLLHFIKRFRPKYSAGWVHEDICRRLERFMGQIARGESPRLLLMMPYRHGKSEISSRHVPPFFLGHHPEWEIIAASNAQSLATSFSRYIRDLMRDPSYKALFSNTQLDPTSQAVESWNTTAGGGYLAAGVGTAIIGRGAHCFPANTNVLTSSGYVKIQHLGQSDEVLGYDHERKQVVSTKIKAVQRSVRSDLVEVTTASGRRFVCTGDHPVYVIGHGYVEAQVLGIGAGVLRAEMSALRQTERGHGETLPRMFLEGEKGVRRSFLFELRKAVSKTAVRLQEVRQAWVQRSLLLGSMLSGTPRREKRQAVLDVWQACASGGQHKGREILLKGMLAGSTSANFVGLRGLWNVVQKGGRGVNVLFERVCERSSQFADARGRKFELPSRRELQHPVPCYARTGVEAGRAQVSVLRHEEEPGRASHQRKSNRQSPGELGDVVQELPRRAPSVEEDSVSLVKPIRAGNVVVYDLQVEGTSNFFAEEILVHNCLIIDDPVRDAEAADSQVIRDNTWEWYLSTAYSRLAPGGGVLGIMTSWNEDDWGGRVIQAMNAEGDQFEIVRYPAVNDQGDEYILEDDSIVQIPPGLSVPAGAKLTRPMNTALHPERYTYEMLLKIKRNYYALGQQRWWSAGYQQNPTPEEGAFFKKDMFQYYGALPQRRHCNVYQAWDFSITEKETSDWIVGTTLYQDEHNNLYVADVRRFKQDDGIELIEEVVRYAKEWDADLLGFEDGQIWKSLASTFEVTCDKMQFYPSYEVLVPLTDKRVRAQPLRGRMQNRKVFHPREERAPWMLEHKNELLRFQAGGKHDDQVDSLAWAVRLTLSQAAPKPPEPPKLPSWKDHLGQYEEGEAGSSHMSA